MRRLALAAAVAVAVALAGCADGRMPTTLTDDAKCRWLATALAVLEASRADHNEIQSRRLAVYQALWTAECTGPPAPLEEVPAGITTAPADG